MADFNNFDINEAKRRVLEMQNRASRFVDDTKQTKQNTNFFHNDDESERKNVSQSEQKESDQNERKIGTNTSDNGQNDEQKSFFVILALILLLSKEDADNTLILALLYLLL